MDATTAQKMMADAIQAMLACGQYKAAQMNTVRMNVSGQIEDVTCVFFGSSEDVLDAVATRITDASIQERVAASLGHDAIVNAMTPR